MLVRTQPTDAEGKIPQRLPRAKVEEPSARRVAEAMKVSFQFQFARAKKEAREPWPDGEPLMEAAGPGVVETFER